MTMRGLSAFPITPTDAAGSPLPADLRRLILRLRHAGVDSIGVLGSTGGYAYLDADQRRAVLETALDAAGGKVPVIAGVGACAATPRPRWRAMRRMRGLRACCWRRCPILP